MSTGFSSLIADLEGVKRLPPPPSARMAEQEEEAEVLEIDLAPLLGLEPAPHRVLRLANLNAVELFRMAESNQKLQQRRKLEGWPDSLCYDVSLLCAMHREPSHEGSGRALVDLYGVFVLRPCLRPLWLYLLERVGRAFGSLVRPELALEIYYSDLRMAALQAGLEAPAPPTPEEQEQLFEDRGMMPTQERHPNDSAP